MRRFTSRVVACSGGSAVELCKVDGGGHTWPGYDIGLLGLFHGKTSLNLDATAYAIDFLFDHSLPL